MFAQRRYVTDRSYETVIASNDNGVVRFPGVHVVRNAGIVHVAAQLTGPIALGYVAAGVFTITHAELRARAA
jgi:hypothetical protein